MIMVLNMIMITYDNDLKHDNDHVIMVLNMIMITCDNDCKRDDHM